MSLYPFEGLAEEKQPQTDEEMFAIARAHMEQYSAAASLDRRLWDATVRIALRGMRPEVERIVPSLPGATEYRAMVIEECARTVIGARILFDDELPTLHEQIVDTLQQVAGQVRALKVSSPQSSGS